MDYVIFMTSMIVIALSGIRECAILVFGCILSHLLLSHLTAMMGVVANVTFGINHVNETYGGCCMCTMG